MSGQVVQKHMGRKRGKNEFTLSMTAREMLLSLSEYEGMPRSQEIERLIRKEYRRLQAKLGK